MWRYFRKKVDQMGFWDWGMLKIYAFSVGVVLGAYFPEFIKDYLVFFIVLIAISFVWMMNSLFFKKH
ncbi:MAG TPA: hypothetical protein EYG92_05650 [Lutibacter sp.]|nr:hypothetical protein [Lutibacter sp.]